MRVKRGVTQRGRHNKIRKATKGMSLPHRSSIRRGKQAVIRSLTNAYNDRRNRKRTFRQLWNVRINAAARENGTTYSRLLHGLKQKNISLNRKVMSEIAITDKEAFSKIVEISSSNKK